MMIIMQYDIMIYMTVLIVALFIIGITSTSDQQHHDHHPNLNNEMYDTEYAYNMIYVGPKHPETNQKLLANESYMLSYIFGTSVYDFNIDPNHILSSSEDEEEKNNATNKQSKQRNHHNKTNVQLKKFGHIDTNPIDGGITPPYYVTIEPFYMDATLVTNAEFAVFVASTYYQTEAEQYMWSYVFEPHLTKYTDHVQSLTYDHIETRQHIKTVDPMAQYWVAHHFTTWKQPEGIGSSYKYRENHPVVHVSHKDAAAYCQWRNHSRLPGEREYEAAARWYDISSSSSSSSYMIRNKYVWGNDTSWHIADQYANLWGMGEYPDSNHGSDGYKGTSPVKAYPPNHNGFYDMTGNVWEWMRGGSLENRILRGASWEDSIDGSLNHAATLGARTTVHGTTTSSNIGFRCAKSIPKRTEHHYTWHDEEIHGILDEQDIYYDGDEDEVSNDDDDDTVPKKKKKKKVVLKPERIQTEL